MNENISEKLFRIKKKRNINNFLLILKGKLNEDYNLFKKLHIKDQHIALKNLCDISKSQANINITDIDFFIEKGNWDKMYIDLLFKYYNDINSTQVKITLF